MKYHFLLSATVSFAFAGVVVADDQTHDGRVPAPVVSVSQSIDPPFDHFLDTEELGDAWQELDCTRLTDIAVGLMEGERVLLRPHRHLNSHTIAVLATRLAGETRDIDCLKRLVLAARSTKNDSLIAEVTSAQKLVGASREQATQLQFSLEETSLNDFAIAKELLREATRSKITGNSGYVDDTRGGNNWLEGLKDEKQKKKLETLLSQSRTAIGTRTESSLHEPTLAILDKLAFESRGGKSAGKQSSHEEFRVNRNSTSDVPATKKLQLGPVRVEANSSGVSVPVSKNTNIGVIKIQEERPKIEKRGDFTIVDRQPATYGVGFTMKLGGSRSIDDAELPEEFHDLAFEQFIDIGEVGTAFAEGDGAILTDLSLQLAEGERVLLRSHRSGLTSNGLMRRAASIAADHGDDATLERLGKAASQKMDSQLAADLARIKKLAVASRSNDTAFTVSLTQVSSDTITYLKDLLDSISIAVLTEDAAILSEIESDIGASNNVTEAQKMALKQRLQQARAAVPAESSSESKTLSKLVTVSRGTKKNRPTAGSLVLPGNGKPGHTKPPKSSSIYSSPGSLVIPGR